MQSALKIWLLLAVAFTGIPALAQTDLEAPSNDSEPTYAEYDQWRGSSLGIRIRTKDDQYFVGKVLDHLGNHPLKVDDQLLQIEDIDLAESPLGQLGTLLKETAPNSKLDVKIVRDDKEQVIEVATYRHELVDIASISERIQKNKIIQEHLESNQRSGELDTLTERMVDAVQNSRSPREAHEGINQVIDEIGISHTAIVPKATYQQLVSTDGGELGLVLRRFRENNSVGYFVVDIKPGTAAHNSSIQLGDQVLFINGVQIGHSRRLVLAGEEQKYEVFNLQADAGESIRLEHRSQPYQPLKTTTLTTSKTVSLRESVASSARVIETGQRDIGYLRFWNLMSIDANRELQSRLETTFSECDALVLDLRGRGGTIPSVLAIDRTIGKLEIPVIAITDELTRSAKELLSYRIKLHEHVTVIGERTSGAVTAATFAKLPSGNALMFPVLSSDNLKRYTDGTILEGHGVAPDEKVNFHEPFCNGVDHLLKVALDRAVQATQIDQP